VTINPHDASLEQALAYDAAFVPRFAQRFGERLLLALDLPPKANVLDLVCRTGYPAVQVLDRVRDGRVIALDQDGRFLELARARAGTDLGRRIFFKQGSPTSLGFSDEIFTNVIGNLIDRVTADRAAVLAESARVLRPGGQLALTLPLRGSFLEVIDLLREVALRHDLGRLSERVDQYANAMPTVESLGAELEARGFERVSVDAWEFSLEYASSGDLLGDPLVQAAALSEWRACAEATDQPDEVMTELRRCIDTYFQGRRFMLSVVGGCATGHRAGAHRG
jgi:ubiquinone/menaquinone biosynthesis C-methylase UbiE